jgi:hypothetical protein
VKHACPNFVWHHPSFSQGHHPFFSQLQTMKWEGGKKEDGKHSFGHLTLMWWPQ